MQCVKCGAYFQRPKSRLGPRKYCSVSCRERKPVRVDVGDSLEECKRFALKMLKRWGLK